MIFLTLLTIVGWLAGVLALIFNVRRLLAKVGVTGLFVCGTLWVFFAGTAMAWLLSVSPPLNDPSDPEIYGMGGAPYGLTYKFYPHAIGVMFAITLVVTVYCFCLPSYTTKYENWSVEALFSNIMAVVPNNRLLFFSLSAACLTVAAMQFTAIGWEYLGEGDLPSWAFRREDFKTDSAIMNAFLAFKFIPFAQLLLCISVVVLGARVRLLLAGVAIASFGSLYYLAVSSRSFTIIVIVTVLVCAVQARRCPLFLRICSVLIVGFLSYSIPLHTRGLQTSGAWHNFVTYWQGDDRSSSRDFRVNCLETVMNVSLAFPVLVEAIERQQGEDNDLKALDFGFRWRMFSPFPSFIDSFSTKYLSFKPQINFYTPYSMTAEMVGLYGIFGVGTICVLCCILIGLGRSLDRHGFRPIAVLPVALLAVFFILQASTYDTRTAMRYFYAAMYLFLILWLLALIPQFKLRTLARPRRRSSLTRRNPPTALPSGVSANSERA